MSGFGPGPYGGEAPGTYSGAYAQPYGYGHAQPYGNAHAYGPAPRPTNTLAIISLVCGIAGFLTGFSAVAAVICGHVARRQIARTGEDGNGMALAGLITGYIVSLLLLAYIAVVVILFLLFGLTAAAVIGAS